MVRPSLPRSAGKGHALCKVDGGAPAGSGEHLGPGKRWEDMWSANQTVEDLFFRPKDHETEHKALQHLKVSSLNFIASYVVFLLLFSPSKSYTRYVAKHCLTPLQKNISVQDIAPLAVFSNFDTDSKRYSSPAPWKNFGALADSVLIPDGLSSPAVCEKVFSLDASAVQDPVAARQQLQQYMATLHTFKGRSLKALPLPPIGGALPSLEEVG